jgi:50S ribosomal protein L16 3-hydroxylase
MIEQLLGGITEAEFFAQQWRRRFLHVPGGARDLLPSMPGIDEVERLVDQPGHEERDFVRFLTFPVSGHPVWRSWSVGHGRPRVRDAAETVNLAEADRWFPALAPLADGLAARFGAPSNVQLFLGSAGGGTLPHRDGNDSFIVQIAGRKRWRCADVGVGRPSVAGNAGGTLGDDARTFDLEPGDVLYKPSNAVHTTEATGGATLSLTCSLITRTAGELLLDCLREQLAADPVWLEQLPLLDGAGAHRDEVGRARVAAALTALAGRLPSPADLDRMAQP